MFFEGKERNLVRKFARKLKLSASLDDPYTIYLQAGGYSQWRRVKELDWALHEIFNLDAKVGALFDRDYRSDEECDRFINDLTSEDLWIGVLGRKEIENYALVVPALVRVVGQKVRARGLEIPDEQIVDLLADLSQSFYTECQAQYAAEHLRHHKDRNKGVDEFTHLKEAMTCIDSAWKSLDGRLRIVPGKQFLASLSSQLQRDFGVSITIHQIVDDLAADEIDVELAEQLGSLSKFFQGGRLC